MLYVGLFPFTCPQCCDCHSTQVVSAVRSLDLNPLVDGVLVQLPLPPHLRTQEVLGAVSAAKDGASGGDRAMCAPLPRFAPLFLSLTFCHPSPPPPPPSCDTSVDGFHPSNLGALALLGEAYRRAFASSDQTRGRAAAAAAAAAGAGTAAGAAATAGPETTVATAAVASAVASAQASVKASSLFGADYPPLGLGPSLGINAPCTALGWAPLTSCFGPWSSFNTEFDALEQRVFLPSLWPCVSSVSVCSFGCPALGSAVRRRCVELLDRSGVDLRGKHVVVVGR